MRANVKDPVAIELVLLAVLQPVQKAVAVGCLESDPGAPVRVGGTPACAQIDVAVVASQRYKGIQAVVEAVDGGQIHRVVAFAHVEGGAIGRDGLDEGRNHQRARRQPLGGSGRTLKAPPSVSTVSMMAGTIVLGSE